MSVVNNSGLSIVTDYCVDALDGIRKKISSYFNSMGVKDEYIARIELAAYEALINIIDHSDKKYSKEMINIDCSVEENSAVVSITSMGDKFDITKVELPDIMKHYNSGKKRGLGIYFIRTLMDDVYYQYSDNTNKLVLKKKF